MVGIAYLLLALVAVAFWFLSSCPSGMCPASDQIGSSLWLLGALFYALAGVLCLGLRKNRATGAFLAVGAVFHIGLIIYVYSTSGAICPVCWKFAALGALLAAMYWLSAERKKNWCYLVSAGPARAMVVVAAILLLLNPQGHMSVQTSAAAISEAVSFETVRDENAPETAEASGCMLQVSTPDGAQTCLNINQKPVLFFAVWCPHCPEALKEIAKLDPEKRPYIVVAYLRDGDTEKARGKLAEAGLAGEPYYYVQSPPPEVQGVPALAWWEDGGLKCMERAEAIAEKLHVPKLLGAAEIPNPSDAGAINAELAAAMINGTVVQPGEVFSFNQAVGPRTASRGFVEGRSVVENAYGELEMVPDIGGGVCRASTVLYQAALNAGLEVVERHEHGLPVEYAEVEKDAAVAWPYWDFKFRNTAGVPVTIEAFSEQGKLRAQILGRR